MLKYFVVALSMLFAAVSCQPVHRTSAGGGAIPANAPGIAYAFRSVNTVGTVAEGLGTFAMEMDVTSFVDDWQTIRLFSLAIPVTETAITGGDETAAFIVRKEDGYYLMIGKSGTYRARVEFVQSVQEANALRSLTIPFVTALTSICRVTIPESDIKVTIEPRVNFGVKSAGSSTEVVLYGANTSEALLSWRGKVAATNLPPVIVAEHDRFIVIGRGSVASRSDFRFDVTQGSATTLAVAVEEGFNILDVKGDKVRSWGVAGEGENRLLTVLLTEPVSKQVAISVIGEKTIATAPAECSLPKIAAVGVREKGTIVVALQKGLRVDVASLAGASQIDIGELPEELRKTEGQIALAFKHLNGEVDIRLNVGDIQAKIAVESTHTVKIGKDIVTVLSRMGFSIRDSGLFRLSVRLPDGLKVSNVAGQNINNWSVKDDILSVDLRSKIEGNYLLTIETEKVLAKPDGNKISVPEAVNVEREVGYIALAGASAIRLELVKFEGLRQISVGDLPPVAAASEKEGKNPPVEKAEYAFRFLKHPASVVVNAVDITPDIDAVVNAAYTVRERSVQLDAGIVYTILKSGVFALKLKASPGLKIVSLSGKGIDDWKYDEKEGIITITLRERTEGTYALNIVGEQSFKEAVNSFQVPWIRALDAGKERGALAFAADPVLRLKTEPADDSNILEMDIKDLPAELRNRGNVALAHKYYEHPWKLRLAVERITSRINVETFHFVSVGEGVIYHSATLNYNILYAGVFQFVVKLPKDAARVDIEGANVKHKEERKLEDGNEWTITLHSQTMGNYPLYVTFQRDMDAKSMTALLEYTGVRALGVERETGYIAVAARPDIQVASDGIHTEGLTAIDEKEVPAPYKDGITVPFLAVYRYVAHPFQIRAPLTRHKQAGVLVAIVENCLFSTVVTEEGQMVTDLHLQMRNTREQYLKILLPSDAEIWHLFVNQEEVTPFTSSQSADGVKETLIPLGQEGKRGESFNIDLRYAQKRENLGATGRLDLACPKINVPVMKLGWTLSLPDDYEAIAADGNMKAVAILDDDLARILHEAAGPGRAKKVDQPASNQGRNIQQEKNGWVMGNLTGGNGANGAGNPQSGMFTGNKPTSRKLYHYQTLIPLRESGRVSVRYAKEALGQFFKGGVVVAVIAGAFLFWRKSRFSHGVRIGIMVVAAMLLQAVRVLWMEQSYAEHLNIGSWTMIAMSVALLAGDLGIYFWSRRESGKPVPQPVDAVAEQADPPAEVRQ